MVGYGNKPEESARMVRDGWLYTIEEEKTLETPGSSGTGVG
jgi:hypothetical protein